MPNVVKGSKQEQMMVVPRRPWQRLLFTIAVLLGVVASALGGWAYGYYTTLLAQESVQADRAELVADLSAAQDENANLRRQIAILDTASVMDQRATEEVQETIRTLRERVAQLEQDVVYYRQVVAEETSDTGLIVDS